MKFDKYKIDDNMRKTAGMIHFVMPYYTKTKINILNKFTTIFFQGKRPLDRSINYMQVQIARDDGTELRMCVYSNKNKTTDKCVPVLWFHGGGYAMSEPEQDYVFFKNFIKKYNAVVFAPDYTKSVEKPFPAAFEDAILSLNFIKQNAERIGVYSNNIFLGGDSAGGGLALALALYARDVNDKSISFVMSIYPMISYKLTSTSKNNTMPVWNTKSNELAWKLYIDKFDKKDEKFKYASPAAEKDFSNLPPILTYVGTEDPFYSETINLVNKLKKAGVIVSCKVFKGCYHGFDVVCPLAAKSKEAKQFLLNGFEFALNNYLKKENEIQ